MQFKTLILISLTVFLVACGKPESKKPSRQKVTITPEQMSLILANQDISCGDKNFCPEGIARMFAINFEDAHNSSTCSAFLIAPDMVMTNSHCVYAKSMNLEKICSGLYFAFPTAGFPHIAQCSKIIWHNSQLSTRRYSRSAENDFALIQLDQNIPLTPLKLRTTAIPRGTKVYPLVVDQQGGFKARITKLECLVEKVIPRNGILQLAECPIISGNSGSPVLDEDHNVVGVVFASSNNTIKKPTDELDVRTKSTSKGFAFSLNYIDSMIGHLL